MEEVEKPTGKTFLAGYPVPYQKSAIAPDFHHIDRLAIASGIFNHEIFEIGFGADYKTSKKYVLIIQGVGRIMNPGSGSSWLTIWGRYMPSHEVDKPAYRITDTENLYSALFTKNHFTGFFNEKDEGVNFRIDLNSYERVV